MLKTDTAVNGTTITLPNLALPHPEFTYMILTFTQPFPSFKAAQLIVIIQLLARPS